MRSFKNLKNGKNGIPALLNHTILLVGWECTSGFGYKGNFVVTDGGLGRDDPDRDLDIVQEILKV